MSVEFVADISRDTCVSAHFISRAQMVANPTHFVRGRFLRRSHKASGGKTHVPSL
jgi:hypothetical protein